MTVADAAVTPPRREGAGAERALLLAWVVVAVVVLTATIGAHHLAEPDEGRNAEVAREMAASGDYVVPHLDGLPYLDKPALYFAVDAVALRLGGVNELAARFPSLLFGFGVVLLTAWFGARLYGRKGGWIAGVAVGASPLLVAFSRIVIFDTALTLFVVLALVAFQRAIEARAGRTTAEEKVDAIGSGAWSALAWAAMGLGVLTKGPVALLIPLLVAAPYAVWRRASRAVWRPAGVLAFAAVVALWVVPASLRRPELLHYALVVETFARVATDELHRTGPVWYFVPILLGGAAPWSVVALAGWWKRGREGPAGFDPRLVYLLLWVVVPFVFFSLSQSKRPQYVLPLVPAVALLVAHLWQRDDGALPGLTAAGAVLGAGGAILLLLAMTPVVQRQAPPQIAALIPGTAAALGAASLFGGALAVLARRRWRLVLIALSLPVVSMPVIAGPLLERVADMRSAAALARSITAAAGPGVEVIGVGAFPPSLPFYLQRPILLSTADGHELTSNYVQTYLHDLWNLPGSPLRGADWWRGQLVSCETPMVFVVRKRSEAADAVARSGLPLIGAVQKYAAYGPCGAR